MINGRYVRQSIMPYFNEKAQAKLKESTVAVVGCGGLGSLNIFYLASIGIGKLILVDDDVVTISNLNRQIIHNELDLEDFKVNSAARKVNNLNSQVQVIKKKLRITPNNCQKVLKTADLIIDAVDNYQTRYTLDEYAFDKNIPIVFGGVEGFNGFIYAKPSNRFPRYNEIFKNQRKTSHKSPIGVYGAGVGIVSAIQCNEAIKILVNPDCDATKIFSLDMKKDNFGIIEIEENE